MNQRLGISADNAENLAIAVSTTVFSVLAVVVSPAIADAGFALSIMSALIGAVSLSAVFVLLRKAFHRAWARPILGAWIYRTRPHDESKRQEVGFGVAEFSQSADGSLHYRVDLYHDASDAIDAATGESSVAESHGTAVGLAQTFEPQTGALWILYQVQYYDDDEPDREGHLYLRASGPSGHSILRGSWASDLEGKQLSAGVMTMTRPEAFQDFMDRDSRK